MVILCKECNGHMMYVENQMKNTSFYVTVDTWVCQRCGRTVEEPRRLPGFEYK